MGKKKTTLPKAMGKRGRPKTYAKAETLQEAVSAYIAGIGHAWTDNNGDERWTWYKPPTQSGLCLALGITPRTWENYARDPELQDVAEWANLVILDYLNTEILVREKNIDGVKFTLQNYYGFRSKQEVEAGPETRTAAVQGAAAVAAGTAASGDVTFTMAQKLELIRRAAREIEIGGPAEAQRQRVRWGEEEQRNE